MIPSMFAMEKRIASRRVMHVRLQVRMQFSGIIF